MIRHNFKQTDKESMYQNYKVLTKETKENNSI